MHIITQCFYQKLLVYLLSSGSRATYRRKLKLYVQEISYFCVCPPYKSLSTDVLMFCYCRPYDFVLAFLFCWMSFLVHPCPETCDSATRSHAVWPGTELLVIDREQRRKLILAQLSPRWKFRNWLWFTPERNLFGTCCKLVSWTLLRFLCPFVRFNI